MITGISWHVSLYCKYEIINTTTISATW